MDHYWRQDLHRPVPALRREVDRGAKRQRMKRRKRKNRRRLVSFFTFFVPPSICLSISLCLSGCSRRVPEVEKRAAVDAFFARARSCWPSDEQGGADASGLKLAIESVTKAENATHVRLVAYASSDEAVDFHLPIYRMSAGRWLINETGRAYLLDERCREFKLKGREPPGGSFWGRRKVPPDGLLRLNPGEAFEVTLIFPPIPDRTRVGALVYGGRVLPFALSAEAGRR